ncbi:MAG: DNA replication protein DnaC [Phenylobacterium sp.]|jgi:DNA replication protein DnaC
MIIEDLIKMLFLNDAVNTHGVGKTMVMKNIALQLRLRFYYDPKLQIIDEVGYLSYGNRHVDLLFEVINSRYEQKSTMLRTNRPLSEWGEVFTGAACVVSLIVRLVHNSEIEVWSSKQSNIV